MVFKTEWYEWNVFTPGKLVKLIGSVVIAFRVGTYNWLCSEQFTWFRKHFTFFVVWIPDRPLCHQSGKKWWSLQVWKLYLSVFLSFSPGLGFSEANWYTLAHENNSIFRKTFRLSDGNKTEAMLKCTVDIRLSPSTETGWRHWSRFSGE